MTIQVQQAAQVYRPVAGAQKGWRARVGVMLPTANTVLEPELYEMAPKGVTFHFARLRRTTREVNVAGMSEYAAQVEPLSELLAAARVDVILFACIMGSVVHGLGYDLEIVERIKRQTGLPAVTASMALVEAMRQFGMKRISVITPYVDELNQREKEFLEGCGFEVLNLQGMGLANSGDIGSVSPFEIYRFGKEMLKAEADGLFISCLNLRTLEIVDALERDLGKPVVASIPAALWLVLRELRIREPVPGCGQLLRLV